ncbi:MAG: glycosyltransferase, partial [Candidatus Micrarchaeia archaeon]
MMLLVAAYAFVFLVFASMLAIDLRGVIAKGAKPASATSNAFARKTLVIIPVRGTDLGLQSNLNSIKTQKHANYDVVVVADSKNDEAAQVARKLGMRVTIARYACKNCSGKNRAIAYALSKFKNYDVYVIADSDIKAKPYWLSALLRPLGDKNTGIATTFPKFVPKDNGFWSYAKMVW